MKRTILILSLIGVFMYLNSQSNKVIFLNSGEQIEYKKIRGKTSNVIYKTPTGTKQILSYDDLHFAIKKKTVYVPGKSLGGKYLKYGPLTMDLNAVKPGESCTEGMVDALTYNNFLGARIGGVITGFLMPVGLIGTAIIAATPPSEKNLIYPKDAPLDDQLYKSCYKKTAKKQKSYQTWLYGSLGVSLAAAIAAGAISAASGY